MNHSSPVPSHTPGPRHLLPPASCSLLAACLLLIPGASPEAATLRWTGLGSSPLWSDAANWDALRVPANGDELLFGGTTLRWTASSTGRARSHR